MTPTPVRASPRETPGDHRIEALTRDLAVRHGRAMLALGADMEWESWTMENLLREMPHKWTLSLIALSAELPVGYAIVSRKPESVHLHHLMVGPQERGSGLGSRLLERIVIRARADGAQAVTLKVIETNPRAIA